MPIIEKIAGVTSEEQSNLLLAAGLDASTADMCYMHTRDESVILVTGTGLDSKDVPCWSIGALWKICNDRKICLEFITDESVDSVVENLVKAIIEDIYVKDEKSLKFFKNNIK